MRNDLKSQTERFFLNRGVGTGEASEARASPEFRAFTVEKF